KPEVRRHPELPGTAWAGDPGPHEVTRAGERDGGDGSVEPRRATVVDRGRSRGVQRQDAGETDQAEHSDRRAGAIGGRALLEVGKREEGRGKRVCPQSAVSLPIRT